MGTPHTEHPLTCLFCGATLRACEQCGKPFPAIRPDQRFCRKACKVKYWHGKNAVVGKRSKQGVRA